MPLTKEENDQFVHLWEDMKVVLTEQANELKRLQGVSAETKEKYDRMEQRLQLYEAEKNRPPTGPRFTNDPVPPANDLSFGQYYKNAYAGIRDWLKNPKLSDDQLDRRQEKRDHPAMKAMDKAIREGYVYLDAEERKWLRTANRSDAPAIPGLELKGLTVGDDTTGGFFAPPEFVPEIIKQVVLYSPIRPLANIRNTSARSVQIGKRVATLTASWVGERPQRTETTGYQLGRIEVPTNELYGLVLLSVQDLEDPVVDLEGIIRDELSEQFGVAEGKAFVSGDGIIQPMGLLTNVQSAQIDKSGTNSVPTADTLITCTYNLLSYYVPNARWLMRRQTVALVRQLKDSQNRYLWEPSMQAGTPPSILGIPYVEVPDMPAAAAGSNSIILGDISKAYTIVDRSGIVFKRLSERYVEMSQVGIYARMRVGGQVVLPEAFRVYQFGP
jgi:HK97 family phage major capsid protein